MKLLDVVREVRRHLEENGRVSLRMLRRQYELDDEALEDLVEELVDVQRVARREENILVWAGQPAVPSTTAAAPAPAAQPPRRAALAETRKIISIIFADLMGSTALHERLDPESVNRVMDAYYQAVRGPVEAAGGTVVQLLGDGVLCAFGIPTIAEDDALRAVRAAMGIQHAFRQFLGGQQWLSVPIGLRVAVNTGEVVVSDEHPAGIGDPLNVAARLQQEARDGEVLVGQATRRLVADAVTLEQAGVFALKGRAETVAAYRVLSLERPTAAAAAAFVGRDDELARLTAVYEAARATRAARLAVLVGSPGLGKSRLIDEISSRLSDGATVVTARCDAVSGTTFGPIAEALREWSGRHGDEPSPVGAALPQDAPDRDRILNGINALLAGSPDSPEETFFVIRRLLTALAQDRPAVLVIDDLHWAEPLLLDLVEHLIQWGSGVPLFVLIGARPELRDLRSSLVTSGGLVSEVVTLAGLDAGAAMRLAANVIGASDLPAAIAAKVLATSEGNPLFVRELVRMLVDQGAIERDGERWVVGANLAAIEMPPTIHALLAARIERLRPEERAVLERAAVVGRHFSRGAVSALLGRDGSELDARLEALRRTELIESDAGWFLGEPVLRFHHVLIRDAAYRRLLKGTRAELHERLADWIEAQAGDAAEHDETIGWHLEQAHQHLREIGPIDAKGSSLGERAAQRLAAAGRRALNRDDLPVAANLLGRAIDRLDDADAARADLALDWCEALLAAGDVGPAARAIDELARFANEGRGPEASQNVARDAVAPGSNSDTGPRPPTPDPGAEAGRNGRLRAWHTCFSAQLTVLTEPQGLQAAADAVASSAQQLAALGDAAGEAKAHSVHATALARLGKVGACEAALDLALAAARRGGDRRRANAVLAGAPLAALWGPSPVTRASGRCLDVVRVLRITQGAPAVESVALSCQGVLEALRGRTEAARRMLASSRKMVEELGIAHRLFEADAFAGRIAAMEGDDDTAERLLRTAYDGLRDLGLGIDAARAGALLARVLLARDRSGDAEALSHESEALAGDDLQAAIAWRGVRAEALAQRGEYGAAIELAQTAVTIASATDALLDHADARVALATALRAAGRAAEADAEERRAIELWNAKGATLLAERARRERTTEKAPAPRAQQPEAPRRGGPGTARLTRRRLGPNAATAMQDRFDAALAARDFEGVAAVFAASHQEIDHPTGSTYGRDACIASLQRLFRSRHPHDDVERLATLGERLLLVRRRTGASGTAGGRDDVGAYENEAIQFFEVDAAGLCCRAEVFAADRLGEAFVRFFRRYAELQPVGPERRHAAAVAELASVATSAGDANHLERLAAILAPDFIGLDHRQLSTWSMHGAAAYLEHLRALREVGENIVFRQIDVLALEPGAFLTRVLHSGTDRLGGGIYERSFLSFFATDGDGRLSRAEWFDDERAAEAMARFEEIVGAQRRGPGTDRPTHRRTHRVRANAASDLAARFEAAMANGDDAAVAALWSDSLTVVNHPTGSTYGRDGHLASLRRLARATGAHLAIETLAVLGDTLVLCRRSISASSIVAGPFDVGAWDRTELVLFESDAQQRIGRVEIFAAERLGDALVRLYESYAAALPKGPARRRAAGIARSVAACNGQADPDYLATVYAPFVRTRDHRLLGTWSARDAEEIIGHFRFQLELTTAFAARFEHVLAVADDRLAAKITFYGIARDSGGPLENRTCLVFRFDEDGRIAEGDVVEAEQEAEALALFETIGGDPGTRRATRRVRANAATRHLERDRAAFEARDVDAMTAVSAGVQVTHHPTGATYGVEEIVGMCRGLWRGANLKTSQEVLATLGDSIALRRSAFTHDGVDAAFGSVGPVEGEYLGIVAVDGATQTKRSEIFAADRLRDAIARAYELYAELLPAGPERQRAAAVARTCRATFAAVTDLPVLGELLVPDFEAVDHSRLGMWSSRGAEAFLENLRSLEALTTDNASTYVDVFALAPNAVLRHQVSTGKLRDGGGVWERHLLWLWVYAADGRLERCEWFDVGDEAAALARFEKLASDGDRGGPGTARPAQERRVRRNVATLSAEQVGALIVARDADGLADRFAESLHVVHHPTSATYGCREMLGTWRSILKAEHVEFRPQILASLGDRLVLARHVLTIEGLREAHVAGFGRSELDEVTLLETDERGRWVHLEIFDADHLRTACVRLYQRYAESLAEGAAQTRVRGAARSLAAFEGPLDADRIAGVHAPSFECVDHRILGTWSAQGRDAYRAHWHGQARLSTNWGVRDVDVLALDPGAVVQRMSFSGTALESGGEFENLVLAFSTFGADGLFTRTEIFEPDQEAEALARFDARIAATLDGPTFFSNLSSRSIVRLAQRWEARDWDGILADLSPALRMDDHRRLVRLEIGFEAFVAQFRLLFDQPESAWRFQLLATRGERFTLQRTTFEAAVEGGGGPLASDEHLTLVEVDADGRCLSVATFDLADIEAAYAELDARYESAEGAVHASHGLTMRTFAAAVSSRDWEPVIARCAPEFVEYDHRALAVLGTTRGGAAWAENFRVLTELAPDTIYRVDHFRSAARGFLSVGTWRGSRDGGTYEIPLIAVIVVDEQGRMTRADIYDTERIREAMARFAGLSGELREQVGGGQAALRPDPFENAASRADSELYGCFNRRDWEGGLACVAPVMVFDERRRLTRNVCGRDVWLEQLRFMYDVPDSRFTSWLRATRGERLALNVHRFEGEAAEGGGAVEIEDHFALHEVDADRRIVGIVLFDLDDEAAAHAELDRRFEAGEGAAHRGLAVQGRQSHAIETRDWDVFAAGLPPDFVFRDHRLLGWGATARDSASFTEVIQSAFDLAPDARYRYDHVRISPGGVLAQMTLLGTRDGGAFENPLLRVEESDSLGRPRTIDTYDLEDLDRALARFAELKSPAAAAAPFANAATRAVDRGTTALAARDWNAFAALMAPGFRHYDRTRVAQLESDGQEWLAAFRRMIEMTSGPPSYEVLATRGERLALFKMLWRGAAGDVGPSEIDWRLIVEVNERGEHAAIAVYDPDGLDAAYDEIDARFVAGEGAAHARVLQAIQARRHAIASRDWSTYAALHAPDVSIRDHRTLGLLDTIARGREAVIRAQQVLVDLAPDVRYRVDHLRLGARGFLLQLTRFGTRDGGSFEDNVFDVDEVDDQGRIRDYDVYDRLDLALARFAELAAPERFENAASATIRPAVDSLVANDWERFTSLFAADFRIFDRRRVVQLEMERAQYIAFTREALEGRSIRAEAELLASRDDRLALHRMRWQVEGGDVGPSEIPFLLLTQVDAHGRIDAYVRWDFDELDAAYDELEARWQAGEAAAHPMASTWFTNWQRRFAERDWPGAIALLRPDAVGVNHRLVSWGTIRGAAALVATVRAQIELAPDTRERVDHVRTSERGVLWEFAWHGGLESGGEFESLWLRAAEIRGGRCARVDLWDANQLPQAQARFAEIGATDSAEAPFANAATCAMDRGSAAWRARDWRQMASVLAAEFRNYDHSTVAQTEADREQWLMSFRDIIELTDVMESQTLATRGERLGLFRVHWDGAGEDVGPSEIDWLSVLEVNDAGDLTLIVTFDPHDLDAAYAELDRRWAAGEGSTHPGAAQWLVDYLRHFAARDWQAMAALFSPDLVGENHRLVGWGTRHGPEGVVSTLRAQIELAPDTRERVDHVRTCARGLLFEYAWIGTHEGGAFENLWVVLVELDAAGYARRADVWEAEQVLQARARFEELAAPPAPETRFANAATRAMDNGCAAFRARDWRQMKLSSDFRNYDRTAMAQTEADREQWLASFRHIIELTAVIESRTLKTRGERLGLFRVHWSGAGDDVGPSEIEWLVVFEANEAGELAVIVSVDTHDLDGAEAELEARWQAGEASIDARASKFFAEYRRCFAARDWAGMEAILAPDLVSENHRLVGWGTLRGPAALVSAMRAQMELAPDTTSRFDHVRTCARGVLFDYTWNGTHEGGPFEIANLLATAELDDDGLACRVDVWDGDQLALALARFAEIRAGAAPAASEGSNLASVPPNLATRLQDRNLALAAAGDLEGMQALHSSRFVFDDRRRGLRTTTDGESYRAGVLWGVGRSRRPEISHTVLATAGDRLELRFNRFTRADTGVLLFEIETLALAEVDAEGRLEAIVLFDPDDRASAEDELESRYLRRARPALLESTVARRDAWRRRDLAALRATLPDDFLFRDHRRTGLGSIESADAYIASLQALFELSPDATIARPLYYVADEPHGTLSIAHSFGTHADGGAFESVYAMITSYGSAGMRGIELFDLEDLDAAKARFEELRPDPLRIPPNLATRMLDRWEECVAARDWEGLDRLYAPTATSDDRRPMLRNSGDRAMAIANARYLMESGKTRFQRTPLALGGDRLVLERWVFQGGRPGADFRVETLTVTEVDADGLGLAYVTFDADDRAAADAELSRRYLNSDAHHMPPAVVELARAINEHDLGRARAALPDDFVLEDHRRIGLGRIDGPDAYIASLAAFVELSPDVHRHELYQIAEAAYGRVGVSCTSGTNQEGGAFEIVYLMVVGYRDGRVASIDFYDLDAGEAALARFEALRPSRGPCAAPPSE